MDTDRTRRVDAALRDAATRIDRVDAEWLLLHALKRPRSWLFAHPEHRLDDAELSRYAALVARRAAGEPVAYLTGRCGFWTLELEVDPDVLIPRADTEGLVEATLARLPTHRPPRVADLGTGSGAIGLAIASERPDAQVVAVDASAAALAVAARNAARLGIANVALLEGDWFAPLAGMRFDLVASNPPYIASGDAHLRQGDLRHEPAAALASGVDGLDAIRRIVRDAPMHLADEGWLLVEHGWTQGDAVRALFVAAGFADVATLRDIEDRERITRGRMPHASSTALS